MRPDSSIRGRFIALVISAIIPVFGWSMYQDWQDSELDLNAARSNLKLAASLGAANQDRVSEGARQLLVALATIGSISRDDTASCGQKLGQLRKQFPEYVSLGVVDEFGTIKCDTVNNLGTVSIARHPFYQRAQATGRFLVGEYSNGLLSRQPIVGFAYSLQPDRNARSPVVFAALDLAQLTASLRQVDVPAGARVSVLDRALRVLGTTDPNVQIGTLLPVMPDPDVVAQTARGAATVTDVGDLSTGRIVALAPVRVAGELAFYVAASMERDKVIGPNVESLVRSLIGITFMALIGLGAAWAVGGQSIVKPTGHILAATNALRNGDLQARVPEHLQQHAAQEFKLISRGVNEMAAALETRVAEAAAETERLETKVAERTKALQLSMKELEAFSSSVSHDLRSPLGAISGYCDRLARQPEVQEGSKAWHYLERIQARAVEMGQLIDGLLSLAQLARAEVRRQPVDLSAIAHDVIKNLQKTDPARCVDVTIEEGLTALGDRRLLHSVLDNLLSNAWKFTSRTGSARIAFSSSVNEAGETVYSVKDNGAGFDMAYAGKLFKTFERMHSQGEFPGTGIGLATAQRIIARHGGWIQASAAVDAGAEFRFTVRSTDEGTTT